MNTVEYPLWAWITFFAIVVTALAVDLGIANRRTHAPTRRETFIWSAVWISLALGFNGFIYWMVNDHFDNHALALTKTKEFFTGYLIELSLSVDNLFVFLLIFNYFKVPKKYQHRVLFWGIFGALVMRMTMIFAGAELVERFHWIIYLFGAFLVYTGIKMFGGGDDDFHPEKSPLVSLVTRFVRISKHYDEEKFIVTIDGKRTGTLLLLVLIVVEVSDLIFAVDSIPAIFGITTDKFIVYTSNVFAILGLRTFFFLLLNVVEKFHYLKYGLAFVLSFIGVKMLLPLVAEAFLLFFGTDGQTPVSRFLHDFLDKKYNDSLITISLGVVVLTLALSVVLSLIFPARKKETAAEDEHEAR
ncbi:MAG TPA: TerC family protein [Pyrinomonadaceae bacterium]|jgi:tellurite resistance protein TerC